jgi:hypothetical protein
MSKKGAAGSARLTVIRFLAFCTFGRFCADVGAGGGVALGAALLAGAVCLPFALPEQVVHSVTVPAQQQKRQNKYTRDAAAAHE